MTTVTSPSAICHRDLSKDFDQKRRFGTRRKKDQKTRKGGVRIVPTEMDAKVGVRQAPRLNVESL